MRLTDILGWRESGQRIKQGNGRAFTLIELMVVISIIAILSALVVGASRRAIQAKTIKRVQAELQNLNVAINAYHNTYNQFPPDNTNNPFRNPLFYELLGTTYFTNAAYPDGGYATPGGQESISLGLVTNNFSVPGFLNTSSATDVNDKESPKAKMFLNVQPKDHQPIVVAGGAELLVVPAQGPTATSSTNAYGELFNLWGYVSTNPTNNPKSYDLWAEVIIGGANTKNPTNIIGNWSADPIVR